jgi:colanic acid biosynthesis glycosyl transferase WcaI
VRILRVRGTRLGRKDLFSRLLDQGTYALASAARLWRGPPSDVVVAMSDPPFILAVAVATARLRGHRVAYWVQDLYPQLAAALGVIDARGAVYRAWSGLARRLYARCSVVVALGPAMARNAVAAGAPPDRTLVVSNWADTNAIGPARRAPGAMAGELGLAGKFVLLYSGNAGRAHTFSATLNAAARLRDDGDVVFLFVGGGAQQGALQRTVERDRLSNVRFLPYVARERLGDLFAAADAGLVTEDHRASGLLLPSKIYGILAAGLPVLFVGSPDSDVAGIVREAGCGYVIAPDDPQGMVDAINDLRASPARAADYGRRAREAAEALYDRERAVRMWDRVLIGVRGGGNVLSSYTAVITSNEMPTPTVTR